MFAKIKKNNAIKEIHGFLVAEIRTQNSFHENSKPVPFVSRFPWQSVPRNFPFIFFLILHTQNFGEKCWFKEI